MTHTHTHERKKMNNWKPRAPAKWITSPQIERSLCVKETGAPCWLSGQGGALRLGGGEERGRRRGGGGMGEPSRLTEWRNGRKQDLTGCRKAAT